MAAGTSYTSIPAGSYVPYSQINRQVLDLEYTGAFVSGTSTIVTINSTPAGSVAFTADHNTTMAMIAQSIQTVLDGLGGGGLAWLLPVGANDQVIRIISPQAISITGSVTTTGPNAPTGAVRAADWLGFVVSQNPGSWSNPNNVLGYKGVAVGISNVNVGVAQRTSLSFSGPVVTGQTVNAKINGVTITVPFSNSHNQTMINLAAAYQAAFPGSSANPVVTGALNNLQLTLVAPNADTLLNITQLTVSGSGTPPTITYVVTLNPVRSNGSFNVVVYENSNFVRPDELYLCTYADGTDGLGNPTGLDYVINGISTDGLNPDGSVNTLTPQVAPSSRIAIKTNPLFSGVVNSATSVTNSNYERYLGGGTDGSIPSTQQIVTGWNDFANPEHITVRILINGGYANPEVHQKMFSIAGKRNDCFAVCDTPSNLQNPEDAANYRQRTMAVNSFWGAIYSPDILIYDEQMGRRRYTPPSGMVAAQYAYNDKTASQYFAPAGLTRGILPLALGCRFTYEEGDRDTLSQAQVNAIRFINGAWTIWGEYTCQFATTSLSSVPVVRMIIDVVTQASTTVAYSVFEPNNAYTWHRVTTRMNGTLQPIEDVGGLTDFVVQCNGKNNTPAIIQQRVMKVALWIKPVLCALYVLLDVIITRQDAVFSVEERATANAL